MALDPTVSDKLRDAEWLCHRYDPQHDAFHYIQVPREVHRRVTFLTDEYLPKGPPPVVVRREDATAGAGRPAPLHFIFHSAFCLSTLMARAFDCPGYAMGLKEPVVLNDLVGWRLRGGEPAAIGKVLNDTLAIMARPFADGEAVIVKPSNLLNGLAGAMMRLRPAAQALFMYAPLDTFLKSVAKKGMWGRVWIRDLYVKQLKEGLIDLGFEQDQYLAMTDLQVAATCWLAQHALFAKLIGAFGQDRIRPIDSEQLLANPHHSLTAIASHFRLPLPVDMIDGIANGPAFTSHSKFGGAFSAGARQAEYDEAMKLHGEEIEKVSAWAKAVADNAGVSFALPGSIQSRVDG